MDNGILDQFNLPEVAMHDIRKRNLKVQSTSDGIGHLGMEHTSGVAFNFVTFADYDKIGSRLARYEKFNNLDLIQWTLDSDNKFVERVDQLPEEMLAFEVLGYHGIEEDKHIPGWKPVIRSANLDHAHDPYAHPIKGECIGGTLKEAYERFRQGLHTPGMPLNKWGVLDDSEVATLASYGVFSVEQFAAKPSTFVKNGRFPKSFHDAYDRAVLHVAAKDVRAKDDKLAEQLKQLAMENSQKDQEMLEMSERMAKLEAMLMSDRTSEVIVDKPKRTRAKRSKATPEVND